METRSPNHNEDLTGGRAAGPPSLARPGRSNGLILGVVLGCGILLGECAAVFAQTERVLARQKSPYAVVSVVERGRLRFLLLDGRIQSGMDPRRPSHMPYTYSRLMGTAIAAWPGSAVDAPADVLVVGLGGGTLSRHLVRRYPNAHVEVAELDPVVVTFARKYFSVAERIAVHVGDGRKYLENHSKKYDVIALDAFGPNYIPPALMTREFLMLVKSRLKPGGLLTVNTWVSSRWTDHETRTYQDVFPVLLELLHPDEPTTNRILIAGPSVDSVEGVGRRARASAAKKRFTEFSVSRILQGLSHRDDRTKGKVLTDANVRSVLEQKAP